MKHRIGIALRIAVLGMVVLVVAGCGRKQDEQKSGGAVWTPAPVTGNMQLATPGASITATSVPVFVETSTPVPVATVSVSLPTAAPTLDPSIVVITEQDVVRAVESGAARQGGAELESVNVDFTEGKMRLTAERATYRFVSVDNLVIVGFAAILMILWGITTGYGVPKWPAALTAAFALALAAAYLLPARLRSLAYAAPFAILPVVGLYALFGVIVPLLAP